MPNDTAKLAEFQALCTQSDYGKLSRQDFYEAAALLAGTSADEVARGIEVEDTNINHSLVQYIEALQVRVATALLACRTVHMSGRCRLLLIMDLPICSKKLCCPAK